MGRVYACVGRYATTPYTIKKAWVRVYCAEELAFYICNNASLLEEDFFCPALLEWLEEECDLPLTAKRICSQKRVDDRLETLVRTYLQDIRFVSPQEMDELEKLLQANRSMSGVQKCKIQGDYFLQNKKIVLAQECYQSLLEQLDPETDREMLASVYHNYGVAFAKLFLYEQAGKYFKTAYDLEEKEEHMVAYLATLRITMSEPEYLKKIATIPGAYGASGILEERLESAEADWKKSDEYMKIGGMERLKEEGGIADYYETMNFQLNVFKEEYRSMMAN